MAIDGHHITRIDDLISILINIIAVGDNLL